MHHIPECLGKKLHPKLRFPGSSCIPIALQGCPSRATPVVSGISSQSAPSRAALHPTFGTRTWGQHVSAQGLSMSCWPWPWALSRASATGLHPSGMGSGAAGAAPTDMQGLGGFTGIFFEHLVVEYL